MNAMRSHEDLEIRLGRIDLQLQGQGQHVETERLACISNGSEPDEEESLHLVGCDDCTELLIELGAGLEALSDDAPELSVMFAERPVFAPKKPMGLGVVIGGLCLAAGAMAAAGWAVQSFGTSQDEVTAPVERSIEKPADPVSFEPTVVEEVKTTAVPAQQEDVSAKVAPMELAPDPLVEPEPRKPMPKPAAKKPVTQKAGADSALPQLEEKVLSGREGPRAMDRLPVNGEARGFGQLRLNSKPAARIWIDGKDRGWTPVIDLRLQAGPHDVRLVYDSPLAQQKEERFRVLIRTDQTWSAVRNNHRDSVQNNK